MTAIWFMRKVKPVGTAESMYSSEYTFKPLLAFLTIGHHELISRFKGNARVCILFLQPEKAPFEAMELALQWWWIGDSSR